jgi:hypothetical protein
MCAPLFHVHKGWTLAPLSLYTNIRDMEGAEILFLGVQRVFKPPNPSNTVQIGAMPISQTRKAKQAPQVMIVDNLKGDLFCCFVLTLDTASSV